MSSSPDAAARGPSARTLRRELFSGLDHSMVMGLELVAGILVYAGLGHLADRWLGTGPWLMALGALLGNAAGLYLIWVRSGRMAEEDAAARSRTGVGR